MVECGIPGHITGLYIFAVVNLCALLNISLVSADVYVIDVKKNSTVDTIQDRQAMFGPDVPDEGLVGRLVYVVPHNACTSVHPPPDEVGIAWIALISRGPCHFDQKVWFAQKAGFAAAVVHNYEGSESLVPMGGDSSYADRVQIPSVFVGYTDGMSLAHHYNHTNKSVLIKVQEVTEGPPATFFLPFIVVVSICFIGVVTFGAIKGVRYLQHIRRTRLSKSALKKIPIRKYKKGDHYDTCAICLEDYEEGEKLRVLPCDHTYHCKCIDPWLTKRKKTCPQCKRRVIPGHDTDSESDGEGEEAAEGASESTPLLGPNNNRRPGRAGSSGSGRRSRGGSLEASAGSSSSSGGRASRGHPSSAFEQSGLPAEVQPEVVVISEGQQSTAGAVAVAVSTKKSRGKKRRAVMKAEKKGDTCEEDDEGAIHDEEGEELEGAVGGVGISDHKDFEEVVIEAQPDSPRDSSATTTHLVVVETNPEPADDDSDPDADTTAHTPTLVGDQDQDQNRSQGTPEALRRSPARDQGSINGAFVASSSSEEDGDGGSSGSGGSSASGRRSGVDGGCGGARKKQRHNNPNSNQVV